jgi:hypothetical protein
MLSSLEAEPFKQRVTLKCNVRRLVRGNADQRSGHFEQGLIEIGKAALAKFGTFFQMASQ